MKKIIVAFIALIAFLLSAQVAHADTYGSPYDGPTESKDILIDKLVGVPYETKGGVVNQEYIDNVSTDRYTYSPFQVVYFSLRVKNTSNVDLINVVVRDFAPDYVTLFENPGTVDGNTLSLNAGDFAPGEEKTFIIRGRINHENDVPTGTTCVTNVARAEGDGVADEDTARFCFHKGATQTKGGITETETIPSTGAEHGMLIMTLSTVVGAFGLKLRKLS